MMTPSRTFRSQLRLGCSIIVLASAACNDTAAPRGGGSTASTRVVITPGQARLTAVGDTMRLRAGLYDENGTLLGAAITWTSLDPSVFTIDQSGLVTGKQALSVGRAVASASGEADTAYVVVANPDASPCLGYSAPVALAVGQAVNVSMSDGACITSAGGGDEYILVPWYGTPFGSNTASIDAIGNGLAAPPVSPSRAPLASRSFYSPMDLAGRARPSVSRNVAFDRKIREIGRRELMPLASRSRATLATRAATPPLDASIPTYLTVGDLVQLNTNDSGCTASTLRTGRVVVTSARTIIVADTANPTGGFSDADYARIAAGYDTLVAAVEDAAFGTPTDIDANGKVVVFFTRAVNELTTTGSSSFVAGYFHPRDLLPRTDVFGAPFCPASNEREMFYMPVPDPNGVVNGTPRTVGFVDSLTIPTLAHENQHLVNFGRRLYVNNAFVDEEPWLNEGLSDIAEELVFYRAAGLSPRQNIAGDRFGTQPFDGLFNMYMGSIFSDLSVFLQDPQSYSPYSSDSDPGTRGAVWAFLRYAADQHASSDGDVWLQLANSQVSGFDNLFAVFGANVPQMLETWSVALYTDDYATGVDPAYTQPSWNFRSVFPALPTAPQPYPLLGAVHDMAEGVSQTLSLHGGSSAFLRFSISTGQDAVVRLTSGGMMPSAAFQATIVRTR